MVTFVLAVEFVGPKYTMLIGIAIEIPFALGELLLGLEAYIFRDWRTLQVRGGIRVEKESPKMLVLQMVAYGPLIVLLVLWFLVDESPRWLLAAGKKDEAVEIIRKGARINQRSVPEDVLSGERKSEMHVQDDGQVGKGEYI